MARWATARVHGVVGVGSERRSVGSAPTMTSSTAINSSTVRVSTPRQVRSSQSTGCGPPSGTRPSDGLKPGRPQAAAGMRIEPPPSEPVATGTIPVATATAEPPEDPPDVRSRLNGLRVAPNNGLSVTPLAASSGVLVLPTTMQPAALRRRTSTESPVATGASRQICEPNVVG